jgi:hypothetical protein
MEDWEKKILENRQQKQQEREGSEKVEEERKTATEANRKKAISFISDKAVPAFEKAKRVLEGKKLNMRVSYTPSEEGTSIEMEVRAKEIRRAKSQPFRYHVEMEYTSRLVTPYARCSSGDRHKIEKTNNNSAMSKTTGELVSITEDDIYSDLMKCFANFDDQR